MLKILQYSELSIGLRVYLVGELGRELQEYMDEDRIFFIDEIFEKYQNKKIQDKLESELAKLHTDQEAKILYDASLKGFIKLYQLEQLHDHWQTHLEETEDILYRAGTGPYCNLRRAFYAWL